VWIEHDFLLLAILFALPGAVVFALRRDLRPLILRAAIASLPFAFTERLFYPEYWSPKFLFDLIDVLGFGLEDLLFVAGLGAFTATAYPFAFRRRPVPREGDRPRPFARGLALIGAAIGATLLGIAAHVPAIYSAPAAMLAGAGFVIARRPDLLSAGLLGGVVSTLVYGAICLVYAAILPGVFDRVWHTEVFLDRFILGVPLEELVYGFGAGASAAVVFPWAFGERFVYIRSPP
jgi:hypothetical protein